MLTEANLSLSSQGTLETKGTTDWPHLEAMESGFMPPLCQASAEDTTSRYFLEGSLPLQRTSLWQSASVSSVLSLFRPLQQNSTDWEGFTN